MLDYRPNLNKKYLPAVPEMEAPLSSRLPSRLFQEIVLFQNCPGSFIIWGFGLTYGPI
jgi:hypothetical protein